MLEVCVSVVSAVTYCSNPSFSFLYRMRNHWVILQAGPATFQRYGNLFSVHLSFVYYYDFVSEHESMRASEWECVCGLGMSVFM